LNATDTVAVSVLLDAGAMVQLSLTAPETAEPVVAVVLHNLPDNISTLEAAICAAFVCVLAPVICRSTTADVAASPSTPTLRMTIATSISTTVKPSLDPGFAGLAPRFVKVRRNSDLWFLWPEGAVLRLADAHMALSSWVIIAVRGMKVLLRCRVR
jgi:hypothetical protein